MLDYSWFKRQIPITITKKYRFNRIIVVRCFDYNNSPYNLAYLITLDYFR